MSLPKEKLAYNSDTLQQRRRSQVEVLEKTFRKYLKGNVYFNNPFTISIHTTKEKNKLLDHEEIVDKLPAMEDEFSKLSICCKFLCSLSWCIV